MLTLQEVIRLQSTRNSLSHVHEGLARPNFQKELNRLENGEKPAPTADSDSRMVHIGTISRGAPTVSHLLIHHAEYGKNCWKIIHSDENREKPFRRIESGETVFMDPETHEIVWGRTAESSTGGAPDPTVQTASAVNDPSFPGEAGSAFDPRKLPGILKEYLGVPYAELDCYELVVQGLKQMGVSYGGKEGLKHHLIGKALEGNLPMNAYLTGGGLIEASSDRVFRRTYTAIGDFKTEAERVYHEIESSLEPGLILSFSTPRRGHTGVISRSGETWTFLNSGELDNSVRPESPHKGVGEEALKAELANWFRRAKLRGESLEIDIGRLSRKKLASYLKPSVKAVI